MDNVKTGSLIRELRKEKGLTQKELAQLLHITDRAVSKWERGLCAPDLSTLEPLAAALDTSVMDLILGERASPAEYSRETDEGTKQLLTYSRNEIAFQVGAAKKRYLLALALCLLLALSAGAAALWHSGLLFVLDRAQSPDGRISATVYSKKLDGRSFSTAEAVSLIVEKEEGTQWRITYGNCVYQGLWWAPDGKKYVLALKDGEGTRLSLAWLERNSESNLNAYLTMGVEQSELSGQGYAVRDGWPDIDYQFLRWGLDSANILIYYAFEDPSGTPHDGYFWYNCETGTVSSVLELNRAP